MTTSQDYHDAYNYMESCQVMLIRAQEDFEESLLSLKDVIKDFNEEQSRIALEANKNQKEYQNEST